MFREYRLVHFNNAEFIMKVEIGSKRSAGVSRYCTLAGILQEMGGGCGDWMELAQDRDRWQALVSTVMNLRVP